MLFCLYFVCGKVSVQSGSMMSTEPKLKRVNKTLKDKCQVLRELEEGVPNKECGEEIWCSEEHIIHMVEK